MERLLADAQAISGVEYNMDNLGDVYAAIHVIQGELGLTGVAAQEASETFTGSMGAMKAAAENVMAGLATGMDITEPLKVLLGNAKVFLQNNMLPMIKNVLSGVMNAQVLGILIQNVTEVLTNLKAQFPGMLDELVHGALIPLVTMLAQNIPPLIVQIIGFLGDIANAILSYDWGSMLMSMWSSIQMYSDGFINDFLPNLVEKLKSGLVNGVPHLIDGALKLVESVTGFIADNAGTIVEAGIGIVKALVEGLIRALPTIIATVPKIIINITRVINENMPKLLKAGLDIIVMLGKGIIQNIPVVIANMGNIVKAILGVIEAVNWLNLGSKLITLFGNGIKALITFPVDFIKGMIDGFKDTIMNGVNWGELGGNIIRGIARGITNAASAVIEAAKGVAGNIFNSVASFFRIGSPSKLMADKIGAMIPAGIADGIEDNMGSLQTAMSDLAMESTASFGLDAMAATRGVASQATGQTVNYGGVTINVTADDVQRTRDFVDWLERQLVARQNNRRAAALA